MSKFSNIYDIDGNIIRRADQGPFTIEETEQLVDDLVKKVQEHPDNQVYKVYLNNAQKWLSMLYNNMSKEDLMKRLNLIKDSVEEAKSAASEAEQKQLEISVWVHRLDELKAKLDGIDEKILVSRSEYENIENDIQREEQKIQDGYRKMQESTIRSDELRRKMLFTRAFTSSMLNGLVT
jgi:chromosome segregation ATPase